MATLSTIIYNTETISARHAPSLNAAFAELYEISGIKAVVQTPDGGARTKEECIALGLSWQFSDHYEDSPKGRAAVDIWNQRTFRNAIGDQFEEVLAKHGWRNITITGTPFPSEPWHFANHDVIPQTAGGGTTPIDETTEEEMARLDPIYVKTLKGNVANGAVDQYALIYSSGLVVKPVSASAANEFARTLGYGATWINSTELAAFESAAAKVRGNAA